jgi:uncharacterized heparinase superfamily protein
MSFAARFHIHPDMRVSLSHRGDILLKLPSGEGWRFRHGGALAIEENICAGPGSCEIAWTRDFEKIGKLRKIEKN